MRQKDVHVRNQAALKSTANAIIKALHVRNTVNALDVKMYLIETKKIQNDKNLQNLQTDIRKRSNMCQCVRLLMALLVNKSSKISTTY